MPELQRGSTSTSIIDVLDHVLDKGIVIDAWMLVSIVGIDLISVEARVVVASIETYLNYAGAVSQLAPLSRGTIAADIERSKGKQPDNSFTHGRKGPKSGSGRSGNGRRQRAGTG